MCHFQGLPEQMEQIKGNGHTRMLQTCREHETNANLFRNSEGGGCSGTC